MPTLVSNYIKGRDIILHGENGILGLRRAWSRATEIDHDIFNASGQFVAGAARRVVLRQRHVVRDGPQRQAHAVVLGAYQVDQDGNLANYSLGDPRLGGIGGAMDLVAGKQQLIIMMEHRDSKGRAEARPQVRRIPLTGVGCVDVVVTDLAILRRVDGAFVIEEVRRRLHVRRGPGADGNGRQDSNGGLRQ